MFALETYTNQKQEDLKIPAFLANITKLNTTVGGLKLTILLAYKQDDKSVFVSDFRVSFREANQVDSMSKFIPFDNRLAFFTAGSVRMWSAIVRVIPTIISEVTFENVSDDQGPLFNSLRNITEQTPNTLEDPGFFGGFAIYVDTETNRNTVFQIEGQAGLGLRISQMQDGVTVIGSGSRIPLVQETLQLKLDTYVANNGFMIRPTAEALRKELKDILVRCGGSVFEKLGISPIFNISGLIGSSFQMFGEELQGVRFISGGRSNSYHFSFERTSNSLILRNLTTNVQHTVHDILSFPYDGSIGVEFDPEELSIVFDPVSFISGSNIYILSQWVEGERMERVVYKTVPFSYNQSLIANPNYLQIAEGIGQARTTGQRRHKNIFRMGILVNVEYQEAFELNIQSNIMNDTWLSTYIENFNDFYFI